MSAIPLRHKTSQPSATCILASPTSGESWKVCEGVTKKRKLKREQREQIPKNETAKGDIKEDAENCHKKKVIKAYDLVFRGQL